MSYAGHAKELLQLITNPQERETWQDMIGKPFPKLLRGFEAARKIGGSPKDWGDGKYRTWREAMGINNSSAPVPGRIFTHTTHILEKGSSYGEWAYSDLRKNISFDIDQDKKALSELGLIVPCIFRGMQSQPDGTIFDSWHFFLPDMKPPSTKGGIPEKDFDGAVTFLAYLLHKKYVTEQDVREAGKDSGFLTLLSFANSTKYQNKVRKALGEELLPEPEQSPSRGSSMD